jgi:hypothetical protein
MAMAITKPAWRNLAVKGLEVKDLEVKDLVMFGSPLAPRAAMRCVAFTPAKMRANQPRYREDRHSGGTRCGGFDIRFSRAASRRGECQIQNHTRIIDI